MKNDNIKSFTVLVAICLVVAALMGIANYFTAPIIEQNEKDKINSTLLVVLPSGKNFKDTAFEGLPNTVKQVYTEDNGGFVFKLVTSGYSNNFVIMCGIDSDGIVTGAQCISSNETLAKEKTYGESFNGISKSTISNVDTISGATLTTKAYKKAIADALEAFEMLSGADKGEQK